MQHSNATHWVNNIDPIFIHIHGNIGIRYYGMAYLLAFVFAVVLLRIYYKKGKSPLDNQAIDSSLFALILGVMIGGRLGFMIFYRWSTLIDNPLTVFKVWQGGMASHGGFIGVVIAIWWISKKQKISFFELGDILSTITPIGLFLGRIANFINGELWGHISNVPWAVIFPASAPPGTPVELIPARHPSQLYEAFLEGIVLLLYTQLRFWRSDVTKTKGQLGGEFLILYAIVRILGEQFREPDASLIMGVSRGIFYSIFMIFAGIAVIIIAKKRAAINQNKENSVTPN